MLRGDDVLAVQTLLGALGYAVGSLDGLFGPKTDAAVRAFQRDNQREVNGVVDASMCAALEEALEKAQNQHPEGPAADGGETEQAPAPSITVRIQMTRSANIAVYGAGEVRMDIEEYLRGVVPSEMYESADVEALKAQAICARTYACRRMNIVLSDTSRHQVFDVSRIGNCPRSDEAIQATKGQVLTHDGKLVDCFYSASNKGMTKRSGDVWSKHYPYYVSKRDEWDEAARAERNITVSGHGIGLSQHGAMWAARKDVSCERILAFYYEGAAITDAYNN
ncbi:SpoIID/LytB domain-containing protein [Eubacteriales bacterium OttesenSCG-928-A19]|nr:SpoIID/LytB domain-containing protein [Eubacteriales bacterium OttesenSCG-928-A19]